MITYTKELGEDISGGEARNGTKTTSAPQSRRRKTSAKC